MTIILVPTERCNLRCRYCFEPEDQRAEGEGFVYNFEAMKSSLLKVWEGPYRGSDVCLHGGECTLTPLPELEKLIKLIHDLPWGDKKDGRMKGSVSMVTNATLITDAHIRLFKEYNVYPGVSCDGPWTHNVYRGPDPSNPDSTLTYNKLVMGNIQKMRNAGLPVSIMCILHNKNASTPELRSALGGWLLKLKEMGITGGRLNPVSTDRHPEMELSQGDLFQMWVNAYSWNRQYGLQWNPVIEMERNLAGENKRPAPCIHSRCDPFNTHTLSILPDGTIGNCDRTFGRGMFPRSQNPGLCGRYESLSQTECSGCEWWDVCGGGCPEEGIGGDWRRKTRWCEATKRIYAFIQADLRKRGKAVMIRSTTPQVLEQQPSNAPHGDDPHGDSGHQDAGHGDVPHGDAPHGDSSHGDEPDYGRRAP